MQKVSKKSHHSRPYEEQVFQQASKTSKVLEERMTGSNIRCKVLGLKWPRQVILRNVSFTGFQAVCGSLHPMLPVKNGAVRHESAPSPPCTSPASFRFSWLAPQVVGIQPILICLHFQTMPGDVALRQSGTSHAAFPAHSHAWRASDKLNPSRKRALFGVRLCIWRFIYRYQDSTESRAGASELPVVMCLRLQQRSRAEEFWLLEMADETQASCTADCHLDWVSTAAQGNSKTAGSQFRQLCTVLCSHVTGITQSFGKFLHSAVKP